MSPSSRVWVISGLRQVCGRGLVLEPGPGLRARRRRRLRSRRMAWANSGGRRQLDTWRYRCSGLGVAFADRAGEQSGVDLDHR